MNQELLNMVIEADITMSNQYGTQWKSNKEELEAFAALVAEAAIAAEREKVEDLLKEYDMINSAFAQDFRARGDTK
jgi:hypothetical protein